MTRIGFYVLSEAQPLARLHFACRLVAISYGEGLRTFINAPDPATCTRMDELLWTYRDQSFVPHEICSNGTGGDSPVVIGHDTEPSGDFRFLLNLADEVPHFFSRFERAAEVVDASPKTRELGRHRFRFYRDRGYPIETHNI